MYYYRCIYTVSTTCYIYCRPRILQVNVLPLSKQRQHNRILYPFSNLSLDANRTDNDANNAAMMVTAGGIPVIIAAMINYPNNPAVNKNGCLALANLTCNACAHCYGPAPTHISTLMLVVP